MNSVVEKKESTAPSNKQKSLDNQIKQSESLSSNKPLPSASEKDLNILKVTEPSEFIGKLLEFVPTEDATSIIKDIPNFDQILEAEYPEYQETIDNILSDNNDPDEGNQDPSDDDDGDVGDDDC